MENVIIKFVADTSGLKPAIDQLELLGKISKEDAAAFARINDEQKEFIQNLNKSTTEFGKLNTEVEGLMAEIQAGVMEGFADHLAEVTKETKQAGTGFKSMRQELKELKAQIASGALGEKELREATKRAAELQDKIGDVNDKVKALASDTKRIDAVVTAFRGVAAAASVAAGAAALFGTENEKLTKTLAQAQGAMALLQGVQELANIATTEGALKTMVLDGAQKAASISATVMGRSIAMATATATAGVSLLVLGLVELVSYLNDNTDQIREFDKVVSQIGVSAESSKTRVDLIRKQLSDEQNVRLQAILNRKKAEFEFTKTYNEEVKKLDENFAKLDSEVKISKYGDYVRAKTKLDNQYRNDMKLAEEAFNKEVADINKKQSAVKQQQQVKQKDNSKAILEDEIYGYKLLQDSTNIIEEKIKYEEKIIQLKKDQLRLDKSIGDNQLIYLSDQLDNELAAYRESFNKRNEEDVESFEEAQEIKLDATLDWWLKYFEIENKFQEELDKRRKEQAEMWTKFAIDQAQVVSDTIFTINSNRRKEETDNIISALDEQREAELSNKNLTDAQRLQIEKRYRMQEARIKQQAWETQRQADISQAIINGALAVGKTLASLGFTPAGIAAAAAVGVQTAAQVAIIQSTPIPKFAEGTEFLVGKGTGTSDDNLAMLSHGERVVPAGINSDYFPALSAIHNRDVEPTFANNILTALANGTFDLAAQFQSKGNQQEQGIDYVKLDKIMAKNKASLNLSVDENGLKKWITKQNNVTEFRNTKLRLKN